MTGGLIFILIAISALIFASYTLRFKIGYISVPALSAGIILIWFVPQALVASGNEMLPMRGEVSILVLAIGSLCFLLLGWVFARSSYTPAYSAPRKSHRSPLYRNLRAIPDMRLYLIVSAFVGFSTMVQIGILMQPSDALLARQPTGLITILRMLASTNPISLFLALVLLIYKRNMVTVGLAVLALSNFAVPILVNFKRNEMIELGAVIVFAFWSMQRISIPRIYLPLIAAIGLMALFGASAVRNVSGFAQTDDGQVSMELVSLQSISEVDWTSVISEGVTTKATEFENGVYVIDYSINHEVPTFGARLWNQFVTRWVPGQFVGADLKASLMIPLVGTRAALGIADMRWQTGTTSTGFSEIFLDFGYLSMLLFFAIAIHARRVMDRGLAGELASAAVYPSIAILVLVSFTHGGYSYVLTLPLILSAQFAIRVVSREKKPKKIKRGAKRNKWQNRTEVALRAARRSKSMGDQTAGNYVQSD